MYNRKPIEFTQESLTREELKARFRVLTSPMRQAMIYLMKHAKGECNDPLVLPVDAIHVSTARALIRRGLLVKTGTMRRSVGIGWTGRRYKGSVWMNVPTYTLGFEYVR